MGSAMEKDHGSTPFTEVMGIIHAGVHTLSSLRGVRVASITGDENTFVDGEFGRDSLTNYARRLTSL